MSVRHGDEPTTIDLHGAKPIDFTASNPDEVREELRQSGVVLARRMTILTGCAASAALALTIVTWTAPLHVRMTRSMPFTFARIPGWTLTFVISFFASLRQYRRLKAQAPKP